MIRKYKAFGLALMALFAFGAIAAQGASAVPLTVSSSLSKVFITGTTDIKEKPEHVFTSTSTVKCKHALYSASVAPEAGAINEITLAPVYKECTAFGFANADIKPNGCTYTLTTATSLKVGEVTWDPSQIHVLCPTVGGVKQKIEITPTSFGVSVCTQSVGEQTPTEGHIVARNAGGSGAGEMDITDEATVKGLSYTGTGGACGSSGANAEYTGNTTTKCYKNEAHTEQVDCTFS